MCTFFFFFWYSSRPAWGIYQTLGGEFYIFYTGVWCSEVFFFIFFGNEITTRWLDLCIRDAGMNLSFWLFNLWDGNFFFFVEGIFIRNWIKLILLTADRAANMSFYCKIKNLISINVFVKYSGANNWFKKIAFFCGHNAENFGRPECIRNKFFKNLDFR